MCGLRTMSLTPQWGVMSPTMASATSCTSAILMQLHGGRACTRTYAWRRGTAHAPQRRAADAAHRPHPARVPKAARPHTPSRSLCRGPPCSCCCNQHLLCCMLFQNCVTNTVPARRFLSHAHNALPHEALHFPWIRATLTHRFTSTLLSVAMSAIMDMRYMWSVRQIGPYGMAQHAQWAGGTEHEQGGSRGSRRKSRGPCRACRGYPVITAGVLYEESCVRIMPYKGNVNRTKHSQRKVLCRP